MVFIIKDEEKNAILQALLEAKFSSCLKKNEIRGSSYVARVTKGLFIETLGKIGVPDNIADYEDYLNIVIADLEDFEIRSWNKLGKDKERYIKNLCSPFSIDDKLLNKLIAIKTR